MDNDKRISPIVWKQTDSGETAFCGNKKVGWVKQSLARDNEYYVTILNDVVKLKENKYSTIKEGKEVFERAFNTTISSYLIPVESKELFEHGLKNLIMTCCDGTYNPEIEKWNITASPKELFELISNYIQK